MTEHPFTNTVLKLEVSSYLTAPRLRFCLAKCRFRDVHELNCHMRDVEIDENGRCRMFEEPVKK